MTYSPPETASPADTVPGNGNGTGNGNGHGPIDFDRTADFEIEGLGLAEEIEPRLQKYDIRSEITEEGASDPSEYPHLVTEALRLHADDYIGNGILTEEARDPNGFVTDRIDHMRGPGVEYVLAIDDEGQVVASLRKMHIDGGGDFRDFPSFDRTREGLSPQALARLDRLSELHDVVEIGGLSKRDGASMEATLEVYRRAIHDSIRRGENGEIWFMGIVPDTFELLRQNFGQDVIEQLGDPIFPGEDGIEQEISLTPVLLQPATVVYKFRDQMEKARARGSVSREWAFLEHMLFFADGLHPHEFGPDAVTAERVEDAIRKVMDGEDALEATQIPVA